MRVRECAPSPASRATHARERRRTIVSVALKSSTPVVALRLQTPRPCRGSWGTRALRFAARKNDDQRHRRQGRWVLGSLSVSLTCIRTHPRPPRPHPLTLAFLSPCSIEYKRYSDNVVERASDPAKRGPERGETLERLITSVFPLEIRTMVIVVG